MDRLGIDIGGTFTDFVLISPSGAIDLAKVPSDHGDLRSVIERGLAELAARRGVNPVGLLHGIDLVVHGTTIATNALIQRQLAKVGLIGTAGFRDVLALREGYKEDVYDYFLPLPTPLVPRLLSLTVRERIDRDGSVLVPLHEEDVVEATSVLRREGVEAVAVCLLWSIADDRHERRIEALLRSELPNMPVFLSSAVSQEPREYPRFSTTALCAALSVRLGTYLNDLESNLRRAGFRGVIRYIQCNGGTTAADRLRERPVLALDSGPAAGPVAGLAFAQRFGAGDVVTLDMGGTSLDVSLVKDGVIETARNLDVHRHRVSMPMVRVHTVGAGGGSLAWLDGAGILQVGPQSAESRPGPACYGRGGASPTVTDANVVLGYFNRESLLGGRMPIDAALAAKVIATTLAEPLGIGLHEAARAVHAIVNENMADAVRRISTEQGHDVRDFVFVAGGGCSAAHAAGIADILGVRTVVIPRVTSVLCAYGAAISEVRHDYGRMYQAPLDRVDGADLARAFEGLEAKAREDLSAEGFGPERTRLVRAVGLRYAGEISELAVDVTDVPLDAVGLADVARRFHALHERTYTFADENGECELLSIALTARGLRDGSSDDAARDADAGPATSVSSSTASDGARTPAPPAPVAIRNAWFASRETATPVFDGTTVAQATVIAGPAIVEEPTTTILVPPGWSVSLPLHDAWVLQRA